MLARTVVSVSKASPWIRSLASAVRYPNARLMVVKRIAKATASASRKEPSLTVFAM